MSLEPVDDPVLRRPVPGIACSVNHGIATLAIDRPEKRNALSREMWRAIAATVGRWSGPSPVRAILITGSGPDFSAGADIDEFDSVYADRASSAAYADVLASAMNVIEACPKPTVAAIRGVCIGAGFGLALRCDVRFAARGARFAITPAKLGLAYAFEDTRRLVEVAGPTTARDLLMSARIVEESEALRMRLVEHVVADDVLDAAVHDYLSLLASRSSLSIGIAKRFVAAAVAGQVGETDATRDAYLDAAEGPDFAEGKAAFAARRPPSFHR